MTRDTPTIKIKIEKGIDREAWKRPALFREKTAMQLEIEKMEVGDSFQVKGRYMGLVAPIQKAFRDCGFRSSMRSRKVEAGVWIFRFWRVA